MRIKGYKQFLEAVSGTELVGNHMGPGYPSQDNYPMKKVGMTFTLPQCLRIFPKTNLKNNG